MEIIPAIDVLGGKVVRLRRGRFDEVTVYDDDPAAVAARFAEGGARRLHVVDLDGAREGRPVNVAAIERILATAKLSVQVGGGVRDLQSARRWAAAGAAVVVGTAAVRDPSLVKSLLSAGTTVVVAIDARDGEVAVDGWTAGSGRPALDVAREMDALGVGSLLYTAIDRDGTAEGPDVEGTAALQREVRATVIASGGIGALEHVGALARAGVRATVCGRALLSGAFTLAEAITAGEVR